MAPKDIPHVGLRTSLSPPEPTRQTLQDAASMLSFWAAIVLPAVYLPLLAHGLGGPRDLLVFLLLFAIHVLALIGGRDYAASSQ